MEKSIFKRTLFLLVLMVAGISAATAETGVNIVMDDGVVDAAGNTVTMSVRMTGQAAGFQFDIYTPNGISVTKVKRGAELQLKDDNDEYVFTLQSGEMDGGAYYRVLGYNTSNTPTASAGEIVTVEFEVAETVLKGIYSIQLKNTECAFGLDKLNTVTEYTAKLTVEYSDYKEILTVVDNEDGDIASLKGTMLDGSVLYFDYWNEGLCFCGARTSNSSLVVPETVVYWSEQLVVEAVSQSWNSEIVFDDAPNLTDLTLPSTVREINGIIPSRIENLYLNSPEVVHMNDSYYISENTKVWVPAEIYLAYQEAVSGESDYWWWHGKNVVSADWKPTAYTVNVETAGTLCNELLKVIESWESINELTVIGTINEDDMKMFERMTKIMKLDLSQTDITTIAGCGNLGYLKEVILPATVVSVADEAFNGCRKLESVNLQNVTNIGRYAFVNCVSLKEVKSPLVKEIGANAFSYCSSITAVDFPLVETVNSNTFENCNSLRTVNLPLVKDIYGYAFYGCESITTVDFPVVEEIRDYAFYHCSALQSVAIPSSVSSIASNAFYYCQNIKNVYCYVVAPVETSAFSSIASAATLHVPAFSVPAYSMHDNWYNFANIVALEENIKDVVINSDFTIYDYAGLDENPNLTIEAGKFDDYSWTMSQVGHLTLNGESALSLGRYMQKQNVVGQSESYWDGYEYIYYTSYPYASTLIANSGITADEVSMEVMVKTNSWNFISFPFDVNVSDIEMPEGTLWVVRKYSGSDRAALTGNTWQNMIDGMILNAGEGYILHCINEENDEYHSSLPMRVKAVDNENMNNIFANEDVVATLKEYPSEYAHNRSWNLIGNPYPCFLNIQNMEFGAPITVWNGNGYTAYSILDDEYLLHPNEAFFVQCPENSVSIKFGKDGRTKKYNLTDSEGQSYVTRAKGAEGSSERFVLNFNITGNGHSDKARLVLNENAKPEYEITCDANKFMSSNPEVPQLYVFDNGVRYAINERPKGDGKYVLGAYFGKDGEYTIRLNAKSFSGVVTLTDAETGMVVNLSDNAYSFMASKGTDEKRFVISVENTPTGIEAVDAPAANGTIYNLNGQRVDDSAKGILIINGKKIVK